MKIKVRVIWSNIPESFVYREYNKFKLSPNSAVNNAMACMWEFTRKSTTPGLNERKITMEELDELLSIVEGIEYEEEVGMVAIITSKVDMFNDLLNSGWILQIDDKGVYYIEWNNYMMQRKPYSYEIVLLEEFGYENYPCPSFDGVRMTCDRFKLIEQDNTDQNENTKAA